jgi:hypothetical protein
LQQLENDDFDFKSDEPVFDFSDDRIPNLISLQAIIEDSPEAAEFYEYLRKLVELDD